MGWGIGYAAGVGIAVLVPKVVRGDKRALENLALMAANR